MKKILAFILSLLHLISFAQDDSEIKNANSKVQQASVQLLVHKNYDAARILYEQASEIYLKNGGRNNKKYLEAVRGMGDCYEKMNELPESIKCYRVLFKHSDVWQSDYACLKLGRLYAKIGNIDAAVDAYEEGIRQYKTGVRGWTNNYYFIYKELFYLYYNNGNINDAIRIGKELSDIVRVDGAKWIPISADLAELYQLNGEYVEAEMLLKDILETYTDGELSYARQYNIAATLLSIGRLYQNNGNYNKAVEYYNQAAELFKENQDCTKPIYVSLLIGMSSSYSSLGDNEIAVETAEAAYNIAVDNDDIDKDMMSLAVSNLANIYIDCNLESEAVSLLNNALRHCSDDVVKARINNSFGFIYSKNKQYDKAIEYYKKAIDMDNENPIYLQNLSLCYAEKKMYKEAATPLIKGWELVAKQMNNYFLQNTEEERKNIWNKYKILIKTPVELLWQTYDDDIVRYAFNSLLITKSVQLASTVEFRNAIINSGDKELLELYSKLMTTPIENEEYSDLELQLISKLQEIDDRSNLFSIRWQDIRKGLKDNELMVEFTHVMRTDTGEKAYFALLLRSGWKAPKCVRICIDNSIRQLKSYAIDELYNSSKAGDLIWKEILNTAQSDGDEIEKIYFVPDGDLYSLAIEYMMCNNQRMNEKYNMHRLSSSRDILQNRKKVDGKKAVLFGGIDYNTTVEDMEYYAYESGLRSYEKVWSYLPGTKVEVTEINSILSENSYTTEVYSGASCVEESFKSYSNQSPDIMHIATHGFYTPFDDESELYIDSTIVYREDESLKRCGLAFAGANNTLLGNRNIPDDIDDGILSASEISQLNLRNTSLVVMSACQTGLGDVDDDGVFGLQRAFKKAGVQSILMTLWSVDDIFTQKFMSEFYKGIANGLSNSEALKNAQQQIKQMSYTDKDGRVHSGDSPYYWAPFIILD